MATPNAEHADRIEVRHLATAVLEVAGLVTAYRARREPDAPAEKALRQVLEAVDRLGDAKVRPLHQRGRLESRAVLAEMYKHVDDHGNLGDAPELAQALCQPPTSQADVLRQVLMTDARESEHDAFVAAWSLTRRVVIDRGGAMESASQCLAAFYDEAPRTYYNWSKHHGPRPGVDDVDVSARFGVVVGPAAMLEQLFTMLEIAPATSRDLASQLVAASPLLTGWENWERDR